MVKTAFVLIEITVGKIREVTETLQQLQGVKSVDKVSGPYDAIAVVEGESLADIGDLLISQIHLIPGIYRTVVCIA